MLNTDIHRIRLSKTDSSNSVNKSNFVDVEMQHHTKLFPFPSISETIDQMEVFNDERDNAAKYRLILTINPYCTNVLFNAVTEIVQYEGTDEIGNNKGKKLTIVDADGVTPSTGVDILGKRNKVTNTDMVRNTEYSNGFRGIKPDEEPFEYHCGYDIFNNHILRNQTFKLVNPPEDGVKGKDEFNTIRDFMRYSSGKSIKLFKRTSLSNIETDVNNKHLYLKDDILDIIDSINANLNEQNGWFGFNNRSSIPSCEYKNNGWEDLNISKVFNTEITKNGEVRDRIGCGFIEMYPDSTLYSFSPKYNRFQNREEQNWDICITYPYENDEGVDENGEIKNSRPLIVGSMEDGSVLNGILLADYQQTIGTSGQNIILFRSYVRHNLQNGNTIKLFYNENNNDKVSAFKNFSDKTFNVVNTGNLDNEYGEYYFYINDVEDVLETMGINTLERGKYTFRFIKVNNDRDCKYYYRKFKKLPNLRAKKEELTDEIVSDKTEFEEYIDKNCKKNGKMRLFNKEQYSLAFSNTIYDDQISQIVFTDSIDIDKFTDNMGRPLTELYITIIKRNKGHNLWYKKTKTSDELKEIEYSHCFGTVSSGLDVHGEWSDTNSMLFDRRNISDVTTLSNGIGVALDSDITIDDTDEFYGDVVEFDQYNMQETVLSDVYFRFNTEQREHDFNDDELKCNNFKYDEIVTDDFDLDGFNCKEYDADEIGPEEKEHVQKTTYRPEGYYYKAHYPIQVREFGVMEQGSYKEINIRSCRPRQAQGLFIEVISKSRINLKSGDILYLCNFDESVKIPLTVNSTLSNVRFLINPMEKIDGKIYLSIYEIVQGLLYSVKTITSEDIEDNYVWIDENGDENYSTTSDIGTTIKDYGNPEYILRVKDNSIPSYAYEVATNIYLWRDVLNVGNKDVVNLDEYPFANGNFYITKGINFFLKRQDPFGYNGLMDEDIWPNDIYGNVKKTSNYEYKDDTNVVC